MKALAEKIGTVSGSQRPCESAALSGARPSVLRADEHGGKDRVQFPSPATAPAIVKPLAAAFSVRESPAKNPGEIARARLLRRARAIPVESVQRDPRSRELAGLGGSLSIRPDRIRERP